jgi:hypothetical protein
MKEDSSLNLILCLGINIVPWKMALLSLGIMVISTLEMGWMTK